VTGEDRWDAAQYRLFAAERRRPFDDLVALVEPVPDGTVVDLGCGSGELTADLHLATRAERTVGVDSSPSMLAEAVPLAEEVPGLSFVQGHIADFARVEGPGVGRGPAPEAPRPTDLPEVADLIFANASLHWVDDHRGLLSGLRRRLAPGGQLAFQVPDNWAHPSHRVADRVARHPSFVVRFDPGPPSPRGRVVLSIESYAELLAALGATDQVVRRQVYGQFMTETADVVEWVKGTLLTPYRAALQPADYDDFLERYRTELVNEVGDRQPYFFGFVRILCWARFP
jgi:trans-aconitate 2-methyltransferase